MASVKIEKTATGRQVDRHDEMYERRSRKEERYQILVKGLPSTYSKPSQVTDLIDSDIEIISTKIENGSGSAELMLRDKVDVAKT